MQVKKTVAIATALLAGALALTACGGGTPPVSSPSAAPADTPSAAPAAPVTMTLWTNATTGPGLDYFNALSAAFTKANPNVTVTIQSVQNDDLDGKLQTALNAGKGSAPDIFLQRGGGKMVAQAQANQVADLTSLLNDATKTGLGGGLAIESFQGKVYAVPVSNQPEGFFYSKDLFQQAGVDAAAIKTLDDLNAAVQKLKDAKITPIALGAKGAWPASHWYMQFALRACSQAALDATAASNPIQMTDPCWLKAGEDLKAFADTKPFNDGFLTTDAQQGAGSSAGMIANHKAAMELMGAWDVGVIADLTPDKKPLPDLGFFPFPSVPGGAGDPSALMTGADGYSCSAWAPMPACADFLNFMATPEQQTAYAAAFNTLPVNSQATIAADQPAVLNDIKAVFAQAKYVSIWLDTLYGQNVGNALNTSVVNLLAGQGTPQAIVDTVNQSAAKG